MMSRGLLGRKRPEVSLQDPTHGADGRLCERWGGLACSNVEFIDDRGSANAEYHVGKGRAATQVGAPSPRHDPVVTSRPAAARTSATETSHSPSTTT